MGTPTFNGNSGGSYGTSPNTTTPGYSPALGDLVCVGFASEGHGPLTALAIMDSRLNPWNLLLDQSAGNNQIALWYSIITNPGATTITVSALGGFGYWIEAAGWSPAAGEMFGAPTSAFFNDGAPVITHYCSGPPGFNIPAGSAGYAIAGAAGSAGAAAPGGGWNLLANDVFFANAFGLTSPAGTVADRMQWSGPNALDFLGAMVFFTSSGGGGGGPVPVMEMNYARRRSN